MMSACIVHPIDQTKIRSQTQYPRRSMLETARRTITTYSIPGLWTGLTGSLLRQATYGTARFGVYGLLKARDEELGKKKSMTRLVGNGAVAGFLAGLAGAPAGESFYVALRGYES
jgi:dicarboxylate transporter 10